MSILVIRTHSRFAVCRKARLRAAGRRPAAGLLIELSLGGCRLSNLGRRIFAVDQAVCVEIEGADPLEGCVRSARDGTVSLRFAPPLTTAALDRLIRACRATQPEALHAVGAGSAKRYG